MIADPANIADAEAVLASLAGVFFEASPKRRGSGAAR